MRIKNFAAFGLFRDGQMMDSGSIHRMENEATRMIMNGEADTLRISVYGFEGDNIVEEICVLSYRKVNDDIIVVNMLPNREQQEKVIPLPKRRYTLSEIKGIIDELMECDSLVERVSYDTVLCHLNSGLLWICDLVKLQQYFEITSIIRQDNSLAIHIRNS